MTSHIYIICVVPLYMNVQYTNTYILLYFFKHNVKFFYSKKIKNINKNKKITKRILFVCKLYCMLLLGTMVHVRCVHFYFVHTYVCTT